MWLLNLKIVLPDRVLERGSLRIENGLITEILESGWPVSQDTMLEASGLTAIPGVIDMHGDMLERELEPRPGTFFPSDVALYELDKRYVTNGITTAYAALALGDRPDGEANHIRAETVVVEQIEAIHRLRDSLLADIRVHARVEVTLARAVEIVEMLLQRGRVDLLSLMDHSPGQGQFRDMARYIKYYQKYYGGDPAQIEADAQKRISEGSSAWQTAASLAALARQQGVPLASHDDDTHDKVEQMLGLGVSISEFPVTLEAALAARNWGLRVAMGAPNVLRGGSHSGNLSAIDGIRAGAVDVLAADYHPASLIQAAFKLARDGVLPLHRASKLISEHVARALQLTDRGRIAPGLRADLVLVEESNTPRVRATLRQGRIVFADAQVLNPTPTTNMMASDSPLTLT